MTKIFAVTFPPFYARFRMVIQTLKILQQILQNFQSVFDHLRHY